MDFRKYAEDLEKIINDFYSNSLEENKNTKLRLTEIFIDQFSKDYFEGNVFNTKQFEEIKRVGQIVYDDFVKKVERLS